MRLPCHYHVASNDRAGALTRVALVRQRQGAWSISDNRHGRNPVRENMAEQCKYLKVCLPLCFNPTAPQFSAAVGVGGL
ncbi:hypothetical protein NXC24_PB00133 (plasmid) [Rhizobium sp. NXC24]|nr:hypothetical protein NXC24_PB00133 [Rhizobium sp. NXC24]